MFIQLAIDSMLISRIVEYNGLSRLFCINVRKRYKYIGNQTIELTFSFILLPTTLRSARNKMVVEKLLEKSV